MVGNPSDLYGGAVLAVPLTDMRATVVVDDDAPEAPPLVAAAGAPRAYVDTSIPRSVGLAGSSALVIATLRATGFHGTERELAEAALAVETGLGTVAGLQDRLVQAYERALLMDFAAGTVEVLQPARPLFVFVVWDERIAQPSGEYHARLRERADEVTGTMAALGDLAREAAEAFVDADAGGLAELIDASFELRRELGPLPDGQSDLVAAVRSLGLPATSPGSGGSAAGVTADRDRADLVRGLGLPYAIAGI